MFDTGTALATVRSYFEAWNRQDPDGIVATFAPGGTYEDPFTPAPLCGDGIAEYAGGLFKMVPDTTFEVVSMEPNAARVVVQWVMKGVNSGPLPSGPPSGRAICVPGCDVIDVGEDGISKVRGYYDQKIMFEQLGYTVEVLPAPNDSMRFGISMHVQNGNRTVPGAFGLTVLNVRDAGEGRDVGSITERIIGGMTSMKGFISFLGVSMADRLFTITAWETVEDIDQLNRDPKHREGVRQVYQNDLGTGAMLSVWEPVRIKQIARCPECEEMYQAGPEVNACPSGHPAAEPAMVF
jgi:steroid delta-isomerase-like uncharacterized protein